jgi:hypothetical protein
MGIVLVGTPARTTPAAQVVEVRSPPAVNRTKKSRRSVRLTLIAREHITAASGLLDSSYALVVRGMVLLTGVLARMVAVALL